MKTIGGDCFEVSGRFVHCRTDDNVKLVHGIVTGQGPLQGIKYAHGWIEIEQSKWDIQVLDLSNGRRICMPKELYYHIGKINQDDCIYYTPKRVNEMILENGHWGYWELDESKMDVISEIGKENGIL